MKRFYLVLLLFSVGYVYGENDLTLRQVMQMVNQSSLKILQGFLLKNDIMVIEGAKEIATHPHPRGGVIRYIPPHKREDFIKAMVSFEKQVHGNAQKMVDLIREGKREEAFER